MMMPTDADLEAMKQMVTAAMQAMSRELDTFNRKAKDVSGPSGGVNSLNSAFTGMSRSLLGPVGLAAGLYAVATQLQEFASKRVQLQMLSTDLGFTSQNIKVMESTMAEMGISAGKAEGIISTLGGQLKNLATMKVGSNLFVELNKMGEGQFAANLLKTVESGDFDLAMKMLVRKYETMSKEARTYLAVEVLGIPESVLQSYTEFEKHVGSTFVASFEHSKRYLRDMINFQRELTNIWEQIKDIFITGIIGDEDVRTKGGIQWPSWMKGTENVGPKAKNWWDNLRPSAPWAKPEWPTEKPPHERATDFGGMRRNPDDLIKTEEDSNKTLRDIRDTLQRMETGNVRTTTGSGSGSSTTYGMGIRVPAGGGGPGGTASPDSAGGPGGGDTPAGAAQAGIGGFRPMRSGGGAAGITAPAGTSIQKDGMATVTTPDGKSFKVDERFKDNFQGFIKDYYDAGGKFGPDTGTLGHRPSNASGHPIGTALDVNQIGYGVRSSKGVTLPTEVEDSIASKWGLTSGNQWKRPDTGHFGIRSEEAARDALVKNGVLPSEAEKIVGAGKDGTVKGSWFDDKSTASGLDASKVAGIALPGREGLGKMHEITMPDGRKIMLPQIDRGPAKWTGRGVDFSKPAMQQMGMDPTDKHFSVRRIDEASDAREAIDKTQSASRVDANMSATVDFKNMPSWVRTAVDDNGKFKDLKVTRSTPEAGKAGADRGSANSWAYE